jgi:hypothetical protein
MTSRRLGSAAFWAPIVGLVLIGAGVASVAGLLVAAGEGHASPALILTAAAAVLLSVGLVMMTRSGRREGGMRGPNLDDEQRRRYRAEFRMRRVRR